MAEILTYGMKNDSVRLVQKALNEKLRINLTTDGSFGKLTEEALRDYQMRAGVPVTGKYDDATRATLGEFISIRFITKEAVIAVAKDLGVAPSIVFAFRDVEGKSNGFLPDGRAIILFERHKFYDQLIKSKGKAFADSVVARYPTICNPARGGYLGGAAEYTRINTAIGIAKSEALKSASWGMFQIMGFNHLVAGYPTVESYVEKMQVSETFHLQAVAKFIKANPTLWSAVRSKNYEKIAETYNGPSYKDYQYDTKLRDADQFYMRNP